ncbi:16S rRNA (adenine(1518)-N(6)/adenine(1519)-N(6))-dimethyltransferaseRsmA [soil metagenome]
MSNYSEVRAKKFLGQHFLIDEKIAEQIVASLTPPVSCKKVLEIGPGMGVLSKYLLYREEFETSFVELDRDSVAYLKEHYPAIKERIIEGDFLVLDLKEYFKEPYCIIGNFPYNISTQILFRMLDEKNEIIQMVGMFQKEVAERIVSPPGNRDYGILSVLLQPWYDMEYLFTVGPENFNPPPKVKSAVIKLTRNSRTELGMSEAGFKTLVKLAFNQRRKTLRNALRSVLPIDYSAVPFLDLRAEALSWEMFLELGLKLGMK